MRPLYIVILVGTWALFATWSSGTRAEDRSLALDEAVQIAVNADDPALLRFGARAGALEESAIADAQLPDPEISGALANVPVDSFSFDQHNMTQIKVGLRQEFPAGRTLKIRGQRRRAEAETEWARQRLAIREIALDTRIAWLDIFFHQRAVWILQVSRKAVSDQINSLTAQYATGRMHAQDMLRAELELSLIDDRLAEHRRLTEIAQSTLARYIGGAAFRRLPEQLPELPEPSELATLQSRLIDHPAVQIEDSQIRTADLGVELAEQAYKPTFALEGGYGLRTDQTDFASVGVTLSLPIFTDKRQDRRRAAAVRQRGAEQFDRDTRLLELKRRLEQTWASWQRLNERISLYQEALGERARQTAEVSVTAFANNQTDFAELIRSRLAELDIQIKRVELETEAAKTWARLAFLTGDSS